MSSIFERLGLAPSTMTQAKTFIFKDTLWLGGKHDGYPRVPFEDYRKIRPKIPGGPSREHAAGLQSLLTFGLLEAVMEVKIPESTLLQFDTANSSSTQPVLTSGNLPALLENWRYRIRQLGNGEPCMQWFSRVQTTLKRVRGLLMLETLKPRYSSFLMAGLQPRELADIVIQIGSVAEAVVVSTMAFPIEFPRQGFDCWTFVLPLAKQHLTDMVSKGWCPYIVKMVSQSLCVMGYAATCSWCPPGPAISELSDGHGKCTEELCVSHSIDTSNYKPKHVAETCNCDRYIKPSLDEVVDLLSTGKIPVIVQCPAPPHEDGFRFIDSRTTPYVAISHVWADGLGSTTEEGLPACQIKRLVEMTSQVIPGTGAAVFWMDALCVPKIKRIRTLAIGLMAQTYKDAAAVLVLDSGIRNMSCSEAREEKLLCVLCSAWMQRLWTLQEGILAQKLIFEFSDGLVSLEELLPVGEEHFNTVLFELASNVYRFEKFRSFSSEFRISDVALCLRWRTSSRESDETLAISGLLNVNAGELAALDDPDQRMQTFLLRVHKLPSSIIFLSGKKMNDAGFRWAPKTFLRDGTSRLGFRESEGLCTSTGLLAEYVAIHFKDTIISEERNWCIRNLSEQRIYKVTDVCLGPKYVEAGYITSYSCNNILLMELPRSSGTTVCAAVLVDRDEPHDEGDPGRMLCEFKKRLFIQDINETEFSNGKFQTIVYAQSGRMRMKVV